MNETELEKTQKALYESEVKLNEIKALAGYAAILMEQACERGESMHRSNPIANQVYKDSLAGLNAAAKQLVITIEMITSIH